MTEAEVVIERLGHLGDGVAPGPIFVPLTLPGETVAGDLNDGRIDTARILTPSAERVRAPCRHFKSCGGCGLMHASDAFVADWKRDVVGTALAAQGLKTDLRPTVTSPGRSRRRATLSGTRTKKGALIGFHARRSDTIVPIEDCHLLLPELLALRDVLSDMTRLGGSRSATLSFVLTATETGIDCAVRGGKPLDGPLRAALPKFRDRIARLTWDGEPVFTETTPRISFGAIQVEPPPGAFLQATLHGEQSLRAAVSEAVAGATHVADLFSGCGTFALPLARDVPVHAVEGDPALVQALDHAVRHNQGLKPLGTETRDLFRRPLLAEDLSRFDAVVIDPPRAGAEAQTREIAEAQVPRAAMVSCNPVTFARDAAILTAAGYCLNWVQPVDQFRWSPHVELAASLSLPHLTGKRG